MIVIVILLVVLVGCFTIKAPELPVITPPQQPTAPGSPVGPPGFDWNSAIAYAASIIAGIIAFIRWMIVEFKHKALIKAGKKDDNRDGKED